MIFYPYVLSSLSSGDRAVDGKPVRSVHFNRIFREITAIQSALGPGERLKGSLSSFDARISGEMNDDGTLERELVTDDDYSGNKRGMYRYVDGQQLADTLGPSGSPAGNKTFIPLALSAWEEPPAFFFSLGRTSGAYHQDLTRHLILDATEVGVRIETRRWNATHPTTNLDIDIHWIAISRNAKVWEDNVAWALPPVRSGS